MLYLKRVVIKGVQYLFLVIMISCNQNNLKLIFLNTNEDQKINNKNRKKEYLAVTGKYGRPGNSLFYAEAYQDMMFFVFFNKFIMNNCKRKYVMQRIKKTKLYYSNGKLMKELIKYRVERFLTNNNMTFLTDQHKAGFSLGNYDKRIIHTELEYGCGYISSGKGSRRKLMGTGYENISPYTQNEVDYNSVIFEEEKSKRYSYTVSLNKKGECLFKLPKELEKEISKKITLNYRPLSNCKRF